MVGFLKNDHSFFYSYYLFISYLSLFIKKISASLHFSTPVFKVDVAVLKSRERKAKKKKKHENPSLTILYINVELISLEPKWSLWILMWVR